MRSLTSRARNRIRIRSSAAGTILDNLKLANPYATFEQVVAACKMAEIHSVIEALPAGYQTEIGERGVGLSGGQRQRLSIARALLKGPRTLIFDEATSSVDPIVAEQLAHDQWTQRTSHHAVHCAHGPEELAGGSIGAHR